MPAGTAGIILRSLCTALLSAFLLLLLAAGFCSLQPDPMQFAQPSALAALYISAAFCGFFASRQSDNPMIALPCGLIYFLLILLLSLIPLPGKESSFSFLSFLLRLGVPVITVLTAQMGRRKNRKSFSRKKHRR